MTAADRPYAVSVTSRGLPPPDAVVVWSAGQFHTLEEADALAHVLSMRPGTLRAAVFVRNASGSGYWEEVTRWVQGDAVPLGGRGPVARFTGEGREAERRTTWLPATNAVTDAPTTR